MNKKVSGKIAQIAIAARDLDESAFFYVDQLGLEREFAAPNVVSLRSDAIRVLLTHQSGHQAAEHGGIIPYFDSKDIEAVYAGLIAAGAPDRGRPHCIANLPHVDVWIAFVADPSGNLVGLIEERARLS